MQQQQQFYLVLPLLVIPFITLGFWAMDGGKGKQEVVNVSALNLDLPEASFKSEKPLDKLQLYELADKDSSKLRKLMKEDPYYPMRFNPETTELPAVLQEAEPSVFSQSYKSPTVSYKSKSYNAPDVYEEKMMKQLATLTQVMEEKDNTVSHSQVIKSAKPGNTTVADPSIERMLAMMENLQQPTQLPDPELQQLDGMLDKILTIQQPGHSGKMNSTVRDTMTYLSMQAPIAISSLEVADRLFETGFYGLDDNGNTHAIDSDRQGTVTAVIHDNQTLVAGAIVKLRLTAPILVGGNTIPSGSFVYGRAQLQQERLQLAIKSVIHQSTILPVKWKVYDLDGIEGIYVPGSIDRDVTKQSGGNAIQSIELMQGFNPSLEMQAANLGIQTAKGLLSKKVKLTKVHLKAGHQILIKDISPD